MPAAFEHMLMACQFQSEMSRRVFDDKLMYYAAQREKFDPFFKTIDKRFGHVVENIRPEYWRLLKGEFIAARMFQENGLIHKYRNHSYVKGFDAESLQWLDNMAANPWRFSFAEILENPHPDFYNMYDVFLDDTYLLYSPGVTATLKDTQSNMWFNLIHNNGVCYQTQGLIIPLGNFTDNDIFFYGTCLNENIETNEDLMADVAKDTFPYFMLMEKGLAPDLIHEGDRLEFVMESDEIQFDPVILENRFEIERVDKYFKLSSIKVGQPPLFGIAYYDQSEGVLYRTAMSYIAYEILTDELNRFGLKLSENTAMSHSLTMNFTIKEILNIDPSRLPIQEYFDDTDDDEDDFDMDDTPPEELEKINAIMEEIVPYINENKKPPIARIAKKFQADKSQIEQLVEEIQKIMKRN